MRTLISLFILSLVALGGTLDLGVAGGASYTAEPVEGHFDLYRGPAGEFLGRFELPPYWTPLIEEGGVSPDRRWLYIYARDWDTYESRIYIYDLDRPGGPVYNFTSDEIQDTFHYQDGLLCFLSHDLVGLVSVYRVDLSECSLSRLDGWLGALGPEWGWLITWEAVEPDARMLDSWDSVYWDALCGLEVAGAPVGLPRYSLVNPQTWDSRPLITVTASSTLTGDPVDFSPANLVDGDARTAWCKGVEGPGIGESVLLEFGGTFPVRGVRIIGGYTASPELYHANSRPRVVSIEGDNGFTLTTELRYELNLDSIILTDDPQGIPLSWMRITVLDVYPGGEWEDMCIAEVIPNFAESWRWKD